MIRPCPLTVECPGEFGTELFGNGDNPFLNLSIEGPECIGPKCWPPPPTPYVTSEGFCCDGIRKFAYGETKAIADAALLDRISKECPICPPKPKKFCADAKCPDGTLIARVCVTSSYDDALTEAKKREKALSKYCGTDPFPSPGATCSCFDPISGETHTITVHDTTQELANALCAASLPECSHGQDGGPIPDGPGPNPVPHCCEPTPCRGPGCNPQPGTFCNGPQECTVFCPDGSPFTKHVAANTFCGFASQKAADDQARLYACQRAALLIICIGDLDYQPCLWKDGFAEVTMSGQGVLTPDIIQGALPTGIIMEKISDTKIRFSGAPQEAGLFDFTLAVSDTLGNVQVKDLFIDVFGLTDDPAIALPEGALSQCFSHQFATAGPFVAPLIWQVFGLPPGITHDGNGLISGTPTIAGDYTVAVIVGDSDEPFKQCFYDYNLHIRDCGTDQYFGSLSGSFDGDIPGIRQIVTIPKQICQHVCRLHSTDMKHYGCQGSITLTLKRNGVQVTTWTAATVEPFQASLDSQSFLMPAQYPASGACPEAPDFSAVYTMEISGGTTGLCTVAWSITGV